MKIPKKISPDNIKDSIIEVRYTSKVPFEVAIGLFYKSLDDTYMYSSRPLTKQQVTNPLPINNLGQIEIQLSNRPLFYNDKIKIELQPNSIIFNCLNEYLTWSVYRAEISKVLTQISDAGVIDNFIRIGVRYISEYQNTDLKDCVKFSFTFGMPEIKSKTHSFHSEFNYDNLRVNLNLKNNLPVLGTKNLSEQIVVTPVSYIDIDVIMDNISEVSYESILEKTDTVHLKQKEVFFSILKENFIESLHPIYE